MRRDDFYTICPESVGDTPPVVDGGKITPSKMQLVESEQPMSQDDREFWCS